MEINAIKFMLSAIIIVTYSVISVGAIGPLGAFGVGVGASKCEPSLTTASGTYAIHKGILVRFLWSAENLLIEIWAFNIFS